MQIAGLQKTSFVDYPGQPAAVVFTPYCNFDCGYCHNAQILTADTPLLLESYVWEHLERRAGTLKALVISGGEPTLQQQLGAFIRRAKGLGYLIKLDTNGSRPQTLRELLRARLIDYIAMDIKAPIERYEEITCTKVDADAIRTSITLVRNAGLPHEFRTTFCPQLSIEDVVAASLLVKGTAHYYLQQYRIPREGAMPPHPPSVVLEAAKAVQKSGTACTVRGLGTHR